LSEAQRCARDAFAPAIGGDFVQQLGNSSVAVLRIKHAANTFRAPDIASRDSSANGISLLEIVNSKIETVSRAFPAFAGVFAVVLSRELNLKSRLKSFQTTIVASSISIVDASIHVQTEGIRIFGVSSKMDNSPDLVLLYANESLTEPVGGKFLQIGKVDFFLP
jgi:hypothetical protein